MLTLEQNIRAVIETCFSESKEELQEIATQRIVELAKANTSNTLERGENRWNLSNEVVPPDGDLVIVSIHDDSGDTPFDYTTAGWHYKDAWFIDGDSQPMRYMVKAWKFFPKPYKGV